MRLRKTFVIFKKDFMKSSGENVPLLQDYNRSDDDDDDWQVF